MTSFIDAIKNAEGTYEKYVGKKLKKRITYLESELAAESRHDGYVIAGFKKELKKLKVELWKNTFTEEN